MAEELENLSVWIELLLYILFFSGAGTECWIEQEDRNCEISLGEAFDFENFVEELCDSLEPNVFFVTLPVSVTL